METLLKYYKLSMGFTVFALIAGAYIGFVQGDIAGAATVALTVALLAVLETSLSFDNAVVNARILNGWNEKWRQIFLTWGILIAVFGMRIVFPIAIVSIATGIAPLGVIDMSLNDPDAYGAQLQSVHHEVAGFGGAFLFMVAMGFLFEDKSVRWLDAIEARLTKLGQIEGVAAAITLLIIAVVASYFPDPTKGQEFLLAGGWGVVTFILAHGLGSLLGGEGEDEGEDGDDSASSASGPIVKAGLAGFLYLELLDASFSFDGVIGAFVLTNYLPVIALGLGVGAFFVRSMTIHLVYAGTLTQYRYLEHGAFYAILVLAILMFASGVGFHLPEWLTGLLGAAFIAMALVHSISYNRKNGVTA